MTGVETLLAAMRDWDMFAPQVYQIIFKLFFDVDFGFVRNML